MAGFMQQSIQSRRRPPAAQRIGGATGERVAPARSGCTARAGCDSQVRLMRAELLLEAGAVVASCGALSEAMEALARFALRAVDADSCLLYLCDETTGGCGVRISAGGPAQSARVSAGVGVAGRVLASGESVWLEDTQLDSAATDADRWVEAAAGLQGRSLVCVPVRSADDEILGTMLCLHTRPRGFGPDDVEKLRGVCRQAAPALRMWQRLESLAARMAVAHGKDRTFPSIDSARTVHESLLRSVSDGVVALDWQLVVVTCNAAASRMFAPRGADIVGQPCSALFEDADAWLALRIAEVRRRGTTERIEAAELMAAGRPLFVNITIQPLTDEGAEGRGTLLVIEDISRETRVHSAMARYMGRPLADHVLGPDGIGLDGTAPGGRSIMATILFADIRGFTGLAQRLGPEGTVALLNEYFDIVVGCLDDAGGHLDKFIGDAVMATFGVTAGGGDDEDRAIAAAIAMVRGLAAWNCARGRAGQPPIQVGIGVNTDIVVAGNIGSATRTDYTVIGDGVNLASRLQQASRIYGTPILISEQTRARLRGSWCLRLVDTVTVRGRAEPVAVHEILDQHGGDGAISPAAPNVLLHYEAGMRDYRRRRFADAASAFGRVAALCPDDRLTAIWLERCRRLLRDPPPAGWDGTWTIAEDLP